MWILLQNGYLYSRMYYNKIRDTAYYWWHTYLLFKCCLLVIPIYSFLLLIGLYCILYNIDVQSPLKTIYELLILFFSAAAIFIIVLLLATLNGSHNNNNNNTNSSNITTIDDNFDSEIISESLSARRNYHRNSNSYDLNDSDASDDSPNDRRRRRSNYSRQYRQQQRLSQSTNKTTGVKSLASNIMTTLFGDFDDPDYCYGNSDVEISMDPSIINDTDLLAAAAAAAENDDDPEALAATLNAAQSRLFAAIDQTADNLEYFLDHYDERCHNIDEDRIFGCRIRNDDEDDDYDVGPQQIIANPLLESSKLTASTTSTSSVAAISFPTLIPPMIQQHHQQQQQPPNYSQKSSMIRTTQMPLSPPIYTNINQNRMETINPSTVLQMTILDDDDRPPSYEEAIGSSNKFM
ncbi:hypothetical protein HUG17_3794 [Dermatophagoides farinae]|uniref:Uncharacterized protein n=1 Tax=Dermatophagoides farinae TaxID=6954 RepID=A0A9D4NVF0_DERFA|nr:hypothetical protein HUG17_3794 [Dermatophagoides farinae]